MSVLLAVAVAWSGMTVGAGRAAATSSWRDVTGDAGAYAREIVVNDNHVYMLDATTKQIKARGYTESSWKTYATLTNVTNPIGMAFHGNAVYVVDYGNNNVTPKVPSKVIYSSDNGQTWTELSAPSGGYSDTPYYQYLLQGIFFDASDNLYVYTAVSIFKRTPAGVWSKVDKMADVQYGNVYRIQDAIADANGNLLASITTANYFNATSPSKSEVFMYNTATSSWVSKWTSPYVYGTLFSDPDGSLFFAPAFSMFMMSPMTAKDIYKLQMDGTQINATIAKTADSPQFFGFSAASDGTFFFLANNTNPPVIRTDHPTFGTGKSAPSLTADTTNNDTAHAIELTFADDADWRDAITGVTARQSGGAASPVNYMVEAEKLSVTGLTTAGDFIIEVKATGYADATVLQTVMQAVTPTLTADTTDNDTAHAIELTFAEDEVWRSAITGVTVSRNGGAAVPIYVAGENGKLTIGPLDKAGTYEIKVNATGYAPATVSQSVSLVPSVWYELDPNRELPATINSVFVGDDQTVYALPSTLDKAIYYKGLQDASWQKIQLPFDMMTMLVGFQIRSGMWYLTTVNLTDGIRVQYSSNQGQTWDAFPAPPGGSQAQAINPAVVDKNGDVYLNNGKKVWKMSNMTLNWSEIASIPDTNVKVYSITGLAASSDGTLYATINEQPKNGPFIGTSALYKYINNEWTKVADGPEPFLRLATDSAWGIHASVSMTTGIQQPVPYIYDFDDSDFVPGATLGDYNDALFGMTAEAGYYYSLDKGVMTQNSGLVQTLRTTNPHYIGASAAPQLLADTTDNDDKHALELTFADDPDWRAAVTNVTVKKGAEVVQSSYDLSTGLLKLADGLPAGTYTIEVTATGYAKATVTQVVTRTAPVLAADTTDNDTVHDIIITFPDNPVWRSSVTDVVYDGVSAASSIYTLSEGALTFAPGTLPVGTVQLTVKAAGYPDAQVTQAIVDPSQPTNPIDPTDPTNPTDPTDPTDPTGPNDPTDQTGPNDPPPTYVAPTPSPTSEIVTAEVRGGSKDGALVTKVEIVRTTDTKGRKSDAVKLTDELAAKSAAQLKAAGSDKAVIVIPDVKDEVAELNLSLPRSSLQQLTDGGIGLTIVTRGATISIPAASLKASSGDLYFRVVPVKDAAEQHEVADRAKANGAPAVGSGISVIGRPMTIETNLQRQPVTLTLPLGDYPAAKVNLLRIYIEHSDGSKEWVKGELAKAEDGGTAIAFNVSKFSTFTVIDSAAGSNGIAYIYGFGDGTFRPNQSVTRAELAAMLARLYGDASVNGTVYASTYKDQAGFASWAAEAIGQATALNLLQGYEDGTFRPGKAVTRAEAATLVARIAGLSAAAQAAPFSDTSEHWAAASISAAAEAGLMRGYEDGSFAPERALTRAEAAVLLNRLTGRMPSSGQAAQLWSDVSLGHWAFADIQAAGSNE
ncbi:hemoblobin-interacting domain-containing protein [Cohnella sp. 56]|uniref:hemoblobin-interacting domain-containing protein n=1 Tax=Cohnella sp. 56 TaxID=3113722 RepID=UPI0030E800CD